jgi:predicted metal-dependent phosphoesterase TrpH
MELKIDLHSHSILSHDGGISLSEYEALLSSVIDYVAITDHNELDFALEARKKLGEKIIVGEEISSGDGDIIGLYLSSKIERGLGAVKTVELIHSQGGLVYIPHPFEKVRKGLGEEVLNLIKSEIDILEVFNGRALFAFYNKQSMKYAQENNLIWASSSDSHCYQEIGRAYTTISEIPTVLNLKSLIGAGELNREYSSRRHLFCPKLNKIKKRVRNV